MDKKNTCELPSRKEDFDITKHLKFRHLDETKYTIFKSEDKRSVSFALWNLSGQLVGFQHYNPLAKSRFDKSDKAEDRTFRDLKYYTWITKIECKKPIRMIGVFGLDLLDFSDNNCFVCEGVFDACRLHNIGLNAIALFELNSQSINDWVSILGYNIIPVCDGDKAGRKLLKLSTKGEYIVVGDGKDLGDLTDEEINLLLADYL